MNTKLELAPINHIAFLIDASGSMSKHRDAVVRVFDDQIAFLAKRSVDLNQETHVSVYFFSENNVRCVVYDRDVLRLPSLAGHYKPDGGTPLALCALKALEDFAQVPQLYADHAFLLYVITDGMENQSGSRAIEALRNQLTQLPDNRPNYTVACLVPNQQGRDYCGKLGFAPGNTLVWDVNSDKGFNDMAANVQQATESYMTMRAKGVRSTTSLFTAQVTAKRTDVVKALKPVTNPYTVFTLPTTQPRQAIKLFVEAKTGKDYVIGSAFYQLVKTETIQANKRICLRTIPDGRLFSGSLEEVRQVLGLPAGGDIKVVPGNIKDFVVFVESTSVNRNIIPGQEVLVMKL